MFQPFDSLYCLSMTDRPTEAASRLAAGLRAARLSRGLSQQALAERADLSVTGIQRIESGERWPRAGTLDALARALSCEVTALFGGPTGTRATERPASFGRGHPCGTTGRPQHESPMVLLPFDLDREAAALVRDVARAACRLEPAALRALRDLLVTLGE
jgi:transcriptional regulator with XRE-family HTH domain